MKKNSTPRVPRPSHLYLEKTPEYNIWRGIRQRCLSPTGHGYHNYGAKGICFHPEWNDFAQFYQDVGPRPSPEHSIDRIDPNGNYEPGNVRWATRKEQANNKSNNRLIEWNGIALTSSQWQERTGISKYVIYARVFKYNWDIEKALTTPVTAESRVEKNSWAKETKFTEDGRHGLVLEFAGLSLTLSEWGARLNLNPDTIRKRLAAEMTIKEALFKIEKKQSQQHTPWKEEKISERDHLLEYAGETLKLTEWAQIYQISRSALYSRIFVYGWDLEKSLHQPTQQEQIEQQPWVSRIIEQKGSNGKTKYVGLVEFNGEEHTLQEWSEILGIRYVTLLSRFKKGWDIERVFTEEPTTQNKFSRPGEIAVGVVCGEKGHPAMLLEFDGRQQTLKEWAKEIGITPAAIRYRIKCGWPLEKVFSS